MTAAMSNPSSGLLQKAYVSSAAPARQFGAKVLKASAALRAEAGSLGRHSSAAAVALTAGTPPARRTGAGSSAVRRKAAKPAAAAAVRRSTRGRPAAVRQAGGRSGSRRMPAGASAAYRRSGPQLPGLRGSLSVIISARNEERTLPALLKQVQRLKPAEIIVVLNGCTDNSYKRSRLCKRATVVHCPDSAGHDVGRAIGAKLSRGDILLFLDGDMVISAPQLAMFAAAVDSGVDVALNDLDALLPPFGLSDDVTRCKMYLNAVLDRSDLGVSSMTAVPHALSRKALERIGCRTLMVPPKAQALLILEQLRVEKAGTVNVIKHNRLRQGNTGAGNAMEQLIAGDHAEALQRILAHRDASGVLSGENLQEQRRQMAAWRNRI
ncbi:glycosyltransferase family A protein [Paenibacillus sp. S150]|uniref:glycosyltransferase family 2 protein n=1 Tax=Paenibacillus sp. S150 TaxID=2749826 RepID=UPI001C58F949|nr:glycosyltransferase family A protein [Paenibacillus sp. S150]MBW4081044.1 glycosyltransferase family 2 protein [Paenibacillus sp. S150]